MKWLTLGIKLGPILIAAVQAVEKLATGLKGPEKQTAAIDFATEMLPIIEGAVGKDLLDDTAVQSAMRNVVDAYVALQNVIAKAAAAKNAGAAGSPTP